jgi:transmembrane sensor
MKTPRRLSAASPAAIETAAADWIARRDMGLTPDETLELQAWQDANPQHAAAWARLDRIWSALNSPRLAGRGDSVLLTVSALRAARHRRRRSRLTLATVGAVAALALGLALRPGFDAPRNPIAPTPTVAFRPDRQTLADGSIVELAAHALITVDFTPSRRGVRLVRGEALFSVAKDAARPFIVSVGTVDVRAVGTQFAVRSAPSEVAVIVTEGRVTVAQETAPAAGATPVDAGNVIVVPASPALAGAPAPQARAISDDEVARALAWRGHRVEFSATPLAEAVALLNRRNATSLALADDATAALRITGVFWTDDPEGFARLVESSLGIKSSRPSAGTIVLGR